MGFSRGRVGSAGWKRVHWLSLAVGGLELREACRLAQNCGTFVDPSPVKSPLDSCSWGLALQHGLVTRECLDASYQAPCLLTPFTLSTSCVDPISEYL